MKETRMREDAEALRHMPAHKPLWQYTEVFDIANPDQPLSIHDLHEMFKTTVRAERAGQL